MSQNTADQLKALKVPEPTMGDRQALGLLLRLAEIDRTEAVARLLPIVTAARLWAEGQVGKVNNDG